MSRVPAFVLALYWQAVALAAPVGEFSSGSLAGWQEQRFQGRTDYALVTAEGRKVLRARSNNSASGLYRELRVDLEQTPYLNWSWRVENVLQGPDESTKAGDDYPARVYVVVSGGLAFWRTRTVSYVWASRSAAGAAWSNAFTEQAQMLAVRSGKTGLGQWQQESRNVREDLRRLFGEDIRNIDAVAVMTDTDNTGQRATAYYGDIFFSAQPAHRDATY